MIGVCVALLLAWLLAALLDKGGRDKSIVTESTIVIAIVRRMMKRGQTNLTHLSCFFQRAKVSHF